MAIQYKFDGAVMSDFATGKTVLVFGTAPVFVQVAGDIIIIQGALADVTDYRIPYTNVIDSGGIPAATPADAAVIVGNAITAGVAGSGGGGSDATAANQTNGDQKTQIVNSPAADGVKVTTNAAHVYLASKATVQRTLNSTNAVANGSTTAGAYSVSFLTSAGFTGTINGIARNASYALSLSADELGNLPAIPYTITAGSILIDEIV